MISRATTVAEYMRSLPADRRLAITAVRRVIRTHLPKGYQERMTYGMIGYVVPLARYPRGYLGDPRKPLPYAGLASQKRHMAVYLMCIYSDRKRGRWFQEAWRAAGKKLDMGKSCVRFRKLEDLVLPVLGRAVASVSVAEYIRMFEALRTGR